MRTSHRRAIAAMAGVTALGLLAGCGGGATSSGSGSTPAGTSAGPVAIDVWGWDAENAQASVDEFNRTHKNIKAHYVLQASNAATQTNFRNVMASKKDIPCFVPAIVPTSTALVNGWAQDITQYLTPNESKFSEGALAAMKLNNKYYGVPGGADATFLIVNKKVYDQYGVSVPKTWDQFIEAGKQFKTHGITMTNLAGEDPSTLVQLAQQAGATWFDIKDDKWQVNFLGAESLKAAKVVQDMVDNDLVAHQTYQDRPALYAYFDSGKMASLPSMWWTLSGSETNMVNSLGDWQAAPIPQFAGAKEYVTAGIAKGGFVPVGCDQPAAAVEYATWAQTDPAAVAAGKTGFVPTAVADPAAFADQIDKFVPKKMFGANRPAVGTVITNAQKAVVGKFEQGPNYDAWFPEMQDQWGKVMVKQVTVAQALVNVQAFVTKDLDSKGISYEVVK